MPFRNLAAVLNKFPVRHLSLHHVAPAAAGYTVIPGVPQTVFQPVYAVVHPRTHITLEVLVTLLRGYTAVVTNLRRQLRKDFNRQLKRKASTCRTPPVISVDHVARGRSWELTERASTGYRSTLSKGAGFDRTFIPTDAAGLEVRAVVQMREFQDSPTPKSLFSNVLDLSHETEYNTPHSSCGVLLMEVREELKGAQTTE